MRYVDHLTVGDGTLKAHSPRLHYTSGNDRWRWGMSGLGEMRYDRWWEVALQIQEAERRTRA